MIAAIPAILTILRSRFTWSVVAAGVVVLAWLQYQGLRADLSDALIRANWAEVRAAANGEQAKQADDDRKAPSPFPRNCKPGLSTMRPRHVPRRTPCAAHRCRMTVPSPLIEVLRQRSFAK